MLPKIEVVSGWNEISMLEKIWSAWQYDRPIVVLNPEYLKFQEALDQDAFASTLPQGFHLILLTSGSTGNPKWCALDRQSVLFNVNTIYSHLHLTSDHRVVSTVPLFHAFGAVLCGLLAKIKGLQYQALTRSQLGLALSRTHVPVLLPLVPRLIDQIPHLPKLTGVSITGGDIVSVTNIKYLKDHLPQVNHTIGYGLTEAGPALTHSALEGHDLIPEHLGSALPDVELKIDLNSQLCFRSPGQMSHFYDSNLGQWLSTRGEWLPTGDLVERTLSGLHFLGRSKWIIKKRGETISPTMIENRLKAHIGPDLDCLVFPVSTDFTDEIGIAFTKTSLSNGEARIQAALHSLPEFFRPRHIIWLEIWPLTPSGKIDRRAILESYKETPWLLKAS